jgi:DNA-directed RNA polymerase specialized sigma24 family protein
LSSNEAAELVARYRSGEKIKDLAASYKIHRSTVMAHLRRAGELKHKGWTDETTAEARKLRAAGLTIVEVAARLGRPPSTVQRRLNQN